MSFATYVEELRDEAQPLALSKLTALSNIGGEDAAMFSQAWRQLERDRRRRVLEELIDLAEDNVELNFDAVYLMALADDDAHVRRDAIRGLWEYTRRDLIDSLIGLLEDDPDAGVRAEAALALGRFVLQAEFDTLREPDPERVDQALERKVRDTTDAPEVRGRALESIGARSEPWVRDLIEMGYESTERPLRLSALHAMGRSCDAGWLPILLPELASDEAEMRFEAAAACGSIADEEAIAYLLPLLHDEDAEVQEAAIAALGQIGGEQARAVLEDLLERADERVSDAVEAALAEVDFAEDPLGFKLRGEGNGV